MRNATCAYVNVGDTVIVDLDRLERHRKREPQKAVIIAIKPRYGRVNNGRDRQNPLITAMIGDEKRHFDNSFITHVVTRAPQMSAPANIYRAKATGCLVYTEGSMWYGWLKDLTILALSKLPYRFERELDMRRVVVLYMKDLAGCKRTDEYEGWFAVDRYRFTEWVRKHHTQLFVTSTELEERETASNRSFERSYYAEIDAEMDRKDEFDEAGFDQYGEPIDDDFARGPMITER